MATPDVKLQVFRGDTPSSHVDFRGDGFIGSPDDEHRTVAEAENVDDGFVQAALTFGPEVNAMFDKLTSKQPSAFAALATALGLGGHGPVRLAIRVYDE